MRQQLHLPVELSINEKKSMALFWKNVCLNSLWVFFTFSKLYKWYQIEQSISFISPDNAFNMLIIKFNWHF